jgi:hypothetical protein
MIIIASLALFALMGILAALLWLSVTLRSFVVLQYRIADTPMVSKAIKPSLQPGLLQTNDENRGHYLEDRARRQRRALDNPYADSEILNG